MKQKNRIIIAVVLVCLLISPLMTVAALPGGFRLFAPQEPATQADTQDPYIAPLGTVPEASGKVAVFDSKPTTLADSGLKYDATEIQIGNARDLVVLSMLDPACYQNKNLSFQSTFPTNTTLAESYVAVVGSGAGDPDSGRYFFRGLGSDAYPYRGHFLIWEGEGDRDLPIVLNRSLFNFVSNEFACEGFPLTLHLSSVLPDNWYDAADANHANRIAMGWQNGYIFADKVVFMSNATDCTLELSANGSSQSNCAKGLIGSVIPQSGVAAANFAGRKLKVRFSLTNVTTITDTSDTGVVAGKVEAGILSVESLSVPSGLTITSGSGNAGGIVGVLDAGAGLELTTSAITFSSPSISASKNAGGIAGLVNILDRVLLPSSGLSTVTLTAGSAQSAGGLYGMIDVKESATPLTITLSSDVDVTLASATGSFGGLVGTYKSADIRNTLNVSGSPVVRIADGHFASNVGGYVGNVTGTAAYVFAGGETSTGPELRCGTTSHCVGGIAGSVDNGCILNLSNVAPTAPSAVSATEGCGGIAGKIGNGSTVRMSHAIDLSGFSQSAAAKNGVFVGTNGNSLVYSDSATLNVPATKIDEIGNYGGVIRLGEGALDPSTIVFTESTDGTPVHRISVGAASGTLSSKEDFARLAIYKQTNGVFGGISGSDPAITLTANIDMSGTGIWGILRDDETQSFDGTVTGNGKTLTLAPTRTIYRHSTVGFLSKISGATTVTDLTIAGSTTLEPAVTMHYGGVAGLSEAALTLTNVACSGTVLVPGGATSVLYAGGLVGKATANVTLTSDADTEESATLRDTIGDVTNGQDHILGGVIGEVDDATVTMSGLKLNGTVESTKSKKNAKIGGLIATAQNATVNLQDLNFNGQTVSGKGTENCGGLLGYKWMTTNVTLVGVKTTNATVTSLGNGNSGGMVTEATGHWVIGNGTATAGNGLDLNGLQYTTKRNNSGAHAGLIIANGDGGLFLEVLPNGYRSAGATVTLSTNYFDELVGKTMSDKDGRNGQSIVSIATDVNHTLIDQSGCNTYHNAATYNNVDAGTLVNPNTRYYYNLDLYRSDDHTPNEAEKLLLWSVRSYAHSSIGTYFGSETVTISGIANLNGYSYYPVDHNSSIAFAEGTTVIFGNATIATAEDGNRLPSDATRQHYMMHCGLFRNSGSLQISGLTLSGSVGMCTDQNGWIKGSGALVCGTISGDGSTSLANVTLNNVTLKDLYIVGVDSSTTFAPLLICRAGNYSKLIFNGVATATAGSTYHMGGQGYAATALLGNIGYITGGQPTDYIDIAFSNIRLDSRTTPGTAEYPYGKTTRSVFSQAVFMHQFVYNNNGSGQYTFRAEDDSFNGTSWTDTNKAVTYGVEISNTDSGKNQGRQYWYFDSDAYVYNKSTTEHTIFFTVGYLRYVLHVDEPDKNFHELDINLRPETIGGCGTYEDPYIIESAAQLEQIQKLLAGIVIDQMKLNVKKTTGVCDKTIGNTGHVQLTYNSSNSQWEGSITKTSAEMKNYLQSAYYQIERNIELDSSYNGLGAIDFPFQGVIFGKNASVTVTLMKGSASRGSGGLILVGNGCVVKDLVVNIGEITIEAKDSPTGNSITYGYHCYYGGVIGRLTGGDTVIDNVRVIGGVTISGDYAKAAMIGGYVGLVEAGGVIFRGTNDASGFSVTCDSTDALAAANFPCVNPCLGRVLDAYALTESEGTTLNGNKNYQINYYAPGTTLVKSDSTITVNNKVGLWALSAIVNSGSGSRGSKDYNASRFRNAQYNAMGLGSGTDASGDYAVAKNDTSGTGNPYLIGKYAGGEKAFASIAKGSGYTVTFSESGVKLWDLSGYGNGYRGIGAQYSQVLNTGDNRGLSPDGRTLKVSTVNGNGITVKVAITMDETDKSWYHAIGVGGLFTNVRSNVTFNRVIVSGEVRLQSIHPVTNPFGVENCVTGGHTNYYAAGIVGRVEGNATFSECSFSDLTVKGDIAAAGFMGVAVGKNYTVTATWNASTTLKTGKFYANCPSGKGNYSFVGGIVGRCANRLTVEMTGENYLVIDGLEFYSLGTGKETTSKAGALACQVTVATVSRVKVVNCKYDLGMNYTNKTLYNNGERDVVGGLIAFLRHEINEDSTITDVMVDNCTMNATIVGGVLGYTYNESTCNLTLTNCKVGSESTSFVMKGNCVGGLIGCNNGAASTTVTNCSVGKRGVSGVVEIRSLNDEDMSKASVMDDYLGGIVGYSSKPINVKNADVQYLTITMQESSAKSKYTGLIVGYLSSTLNAENCNIAFNTVVNGAPGQNYFVSGGAGRLDTESAILKGHDVLWEDNVLSATNTSSGNLKIGTWAGSVSKGKVQLVGVATKCTTVNKPRRDIAANENETAATLNGSYIVYADYLVSVSGLATGDPPQLITQPGYVVALGSLELYGGDGLAFTDASKTQSVLAKIVADIDQGEAGNRYFRTLTGLTDGVLYTGNVLNTFGSVQGVEGLTTDFPVILVKDTANIVYALDLLTNGGYSAAIAAGAASISVSTYNYGGSAFAEYRGPEGARPTLKYENREFQVFSGRNDKGVNRFTLITVTFRIDGTNDYVLYLPVIVDRPIEIYFTTYAALGNEFITDVNRSAFQCAPLVASYGNTASFLLEYRYYYGNWGGLTNLDWYFEKIIDLNYILGTSAMLPAGARVTLVDLNKTGAGGVYWYGVDLTKNITSLNLRTTFSPAGWDPITMQELAVIEGGNVKRMGVERYILLIDFPKLTDGSSDVSFSIYRKDGLDCYTPASTQTESYSNVITVGPATLDTTNGTVTPVSGAAGKYVICQLMKDCKQTVSFSSHEDESADTMKAIANAAFPAKLILNASDQITYGTAYGGRSDTLQGTFLDFVFSMQETVADSHAVFSSQISATITGSVVFTVKDKDGNVITMEGLPTGYAFSIEENGKDITLPFGTAINDYYNLQKVIYAKQSDGLITVEAEVRLNYSYDAKVKNFPEAPIPPAGTLPKDYVQFICSSRLSSSDMSSGSHSKAIDTKSYYFRAGADETKNPELDFFLVEDHEKGFDAAGSNNFGGDYSSPLVIPAMAQLYLNDITDPDTVKYAQFTMSLMKKENSGAWPLVSIGDYLTSVSIDSGNVTVTDFKWTIENEGNFSGLLSGDGSIVNIPVVLTAVNPAMSGTSELYTSFRVVITVQLYGEDDKQLATGVIQDSLVYLIAKVSTSLQN